MLILGIESSCDDTGIALICSENGVLCNKVHSQFSTHNQHGGIVPELASRDHVNNIDKLLKQALDESNLNLNKIDLIAYTKGPGLIGSLMVGTAFAKGLGYKFNKPTLGIHHLEGHIASAFTEFDNQPIFPHLCLLVSGGHTMLIHVKGVGEYQIIGETLDDAAGEAFDKAAKIMGLGYPGGKIIDNLAKNGDKSRFNFPRPLNKKDNFDFSFSGIKTHTLQVWNSTDKSDVDKSDLAACLQKCVIDSLVNKAENALKHFNLECLVIAGGVSANSYLRERIKGLQHSYKVYMPKLEYCMDNAAMIAMAALLRIKANKVYVEDESISPVSRWSLEDLN